MIWGYIKQQWHCLINFHQPFEVHHHGKLTRLSCNNCREVFFENLEER